MMRRGSFVAMTMLVLALLAACGGQSGSSRIIEKSAPLEKPISFPGEIASFQNTAPLGAWTNYIFKGKINRVTEIKVALGEDTDAEKSGAAGYWLSVCDVEVETILFGEIPGIDAGDKIKVVFLSSTRRLIRTEIRLTENQEYYFLTCILLKNTHPSTVNDLDLPRFANVQGGTIYHLMPVNNDVVTFREDWPFEGAKRPDTAENKETLKNVIATIDEQSFLEQFTAMIEDAKGAPKPES
jgi:hypothetical protein